MESNNVVYAIILTLLAGLATGLGGLSIYFTKKYSGKFLAVSLGFSAGVMLFISLVELLNESTASLSLLYGNGYGKAYGYISFFAGIALIAIIDRLIPEKENPHELNFVNGAEKDKGSLTKIGLVSALAIAVHNFPEGIATFATAMDNTGNGAGIAIAIALHNIPEGIAIAVPIYFATGRKFHALILSLMSGLAEPFGGIAGYYLFSEIMNEAFTGIILAAVAGIMVYISLDELLPTAEKYGEHHPAITGVISGMAFMGISLLII